MERKHEIIERRSIENTHSFSFVAILTAVTFLAGETRVSGSSHRTFHTTITWNTRKTLRTYEAETNKTKSQSIDVT